MSSGTGTHRESGRAGLLIGLVLGSPLMGYGVWWLLHNARLTMPRGWVATLVGAAIVHDLLLVPGLLGVGWMLRRAAPAWLRPVLTAALAVSGVLVLYAVPLLTRAGERPSNPTLLPHDYAANLLAVLAAVWLVAAVTALWRWRARR